jgi:hypothetical protein
MCKGDDLEDGLLVPNLSISHLTPELEKQEFLVRQSDKKLKKKER